MLPLRQITKTISSPRATRVTYAVPLETVYTYTERAELSMEIEQKIKIQNEEASPMRLLFTD
jgi:hypothetical protein